MAEPLHADDIRALQAMADRPLGYAFSATLIAHLCGIEGKARVARFRVNVLGRLMRHDFADRVRARPARYIITAAGLAALADKEGLNERS